MANRILWYVLNVLTVVLLVVVIISLRDAIKIHNQEMINISSIEQKLQGLDIQCVQSE